jgi:NitT/TauT family transport system substrate-binding protein
MAAGAEQELRVAVNQTTIESAPLFVQGIPGVRIVPVPNGRVASAQLVSGAVDAATGSETQALLNSVAQPDLRIVLTLAECRYRLVARRSAGIRAVPDLRGKRVAVTRNTSSEYFLADLLAAARLKESDVSLVFLEGAAMPPALAQSEVDAIAIWEPYAQNAIEVLGGEAQVLEDPSRYRERFNLNTTLRVLNDPAKRRALVNLVRGVRRVSVQLESAPRDLVPVLAKAIATPEPVIAKVWGQFLFPAALDQPRLRSLLASIEPWAAAISQRQPRAQAALAAMLDGSILVEARE